MIEIANAIIENFDINEDKYLTELNLENKFTLKGSIDNNFVYSKKDSDSGKIHINFHNCKNSKIFIGSNFRGSVNIFVKGDNSIIYIGDNVFFTNVQIRSFQNSDKIFLGNKVSSTGNTLFISGGECASNSDTGIIIGDDCLFSYGITIRNGDAHPIYNIDTMKLINTPIKPIVLEPHIWIGQNVSILKNVKIGACSILGLGSIVTKSLPRFSISAGIPAKYKVNKKIFWSRNQSDYSINLAKKYTNKYLV